MSELIGRDQDGPSIPIPESPVFIVDRSEDRYERRRSHKEQTERASASREAVIEKLRTERHNTRLELCERLGDFGFAYEPEDHSIVKITVVAPPEAETVAPSPGHVAEPFDPQKYGVKQRSVASTPTDLIGKLDRMLWVVVPFLGAFLGYSIGLLAGLPVKRETGPLVGALVFGIALLAAMKSAVYTIPYHLLRQERRTGRPGYRIVSMIAVGLFIFAELCLGTVAITRYSQDRAFTQSEVLPWFVSACLALCFSCPVLAATASKGWIDGSSYDDSVERAEQEAERYHSELAQAVRAHELKLEQRDRESRERREEAIREFAEANEKYQSDDRWKLAMALFSAIRCLDQEIRDQEQLLVNYKISRGHQLSSEVSVR